MDLTKMTNEELKAYMEQVKEEGRKEGEKRASKSNATFSNVTETFGSKTLPPHEYLQQLALDDDDTSNTCKQN